MSAQFTIEVSGLNEKLFLEKAQAVFRETHNIAQTADPVHVIDDTEMAVITQGN